MSHYWLTFTDRSRPVGDQHRHVITAVPSQAAAVCAVIVRGLDVAGEVCGNDLDDCDTAPLMPYMDRVLTNADCVAMEAALFAGRV